MENHSETLDSSPVVRRYVNGRRYNANLIYENVSDHDLQQQNGLQYQQSSQATIVGKRREEHRPCCRRHRHYKLQRLASQSIDFLDLASLTGENATGIFLNSNAVRGRGSPLLSATSISPFSHSTSEATAQAEGSDHANNAPEFNLNQANGLTDTQTLRASTLEYDCVTALVERCGRRTFSSVLTHTIYSNENIASIDQETSSNASKHRNVYRPSSLGTVHSSSSLLSNGLDVVVDGSNLSESGYVESDCEEYCFTERGEHSQQLAVSNENTSQQTEANMLLDISTVIDANEKITPASSNNYTYSPEAQFGVLRLFFQPDCNATRQVEHTSVPSRVVINKSPFLIGADAECDLVFDNTKYKQIYGRHCKIVFSNCDTGETDLKSLGICAYEVEIAKINPEATIFVNNVPVRCRGKLRNGDVLAFGPRKVALSFTVAFRTRDACLALINQLNSLMLTPSSDSVQRRIRDRSPAAGDSIFSPSTNVERANRDVDLECNVSVAVFEQYYGDASIIGGLSQDCDETPCAGSQSTAWSVPQTPSAIIGFTDILSGDTPQRHSYTNNTKSQLSQGPTRSPINLMSTNHNEVFSQESDPKTPCQLLRVDLESCNITNNNSISRHYQDDESLSGQLLLSAYTTGWKSADEMDQKYGKNGETKHDDAMSRVKAAKVAKLRSLNRSSVPIVVDSSRSFSSEEDNPCITVAKLRFLGIVNATYQTTLEDLLPSIDGLLRIYKDQSPNSRRSVLSDYELLLKRSGDPLSEDACKYNWVFQLDFFDRDDPLFRRAIYSSHRCVESDRERLRNAVSSTIEQLNRSRVLYIQTRDVAEQIGAMTLREVSTSSRDWFIVAHGKITQLYRFSPRGGSSSPDDECVMLWEENDIAFCCPSNDGHKVCIHRNGSASLELFNLLARSPITTIDLPSGCPLSAALFSPKDHYLVVHTAWSEENDNNLVIYRLNGDKATPVFSTQYSKSYAVKRYPVWTPCEKYCALRVNNDILVWQDGDFSAEGSVGKISFSADAETAKPFPTNAILSISPVSKNGACYLAIFSPNYQKFANGLVKIFNVTDVTKPVYERLFTAAEEGEFFWSNRGNTAILRTFTNNVKGLSSYYGGNGLYLLQPGKGKHRTVMEPTEGQAHDISWSRLSNDVLIVKGTRPAELDMYDGTNGNKLLTFGRNNRNTIRRDPFDRLVLVGGFGNLSGEIDIWDLKNRRIIAQSKSECAVFCDFAPDGRYFVTATTQPRMRVNNCFKVYSYSGKLIKQVDFDELYLVYLCAPGSNFTERDPSPGACTVEATVKKSVYRPPGYRSDGPAATLARVDVQTMVATPVTRKAASVPKGPPGADLTLLNAAAKVCRKKKTQPHSENK
ncbi:Eukaryotic translation initiation factor 2A [Babesia sp. Xinjiang]|uniref:Eukaryotic translation initiation factor 2A n=1 Tax=Babesia sp. Xinjiang TaxID=462227 RepID=UPI000A2641C1|nr:Eukaryotic translation initiation factor 2A [Babesia sp. Xinjiang]ORM39429.1 Eukaryotic translation initiation factor 2A [Babesia sp. Xinjiang]